MFEYVFKQDGNSDVFNHTVIVTQIYILTSITTLFQSYDSTLMRYVGTRMSLKSNSLRLEPVVDSLVAVELVCHCRDN